MEKVLKVIKKIAILITVIILVVVIGICAYLFFNAMNTGPIDGTDFTWLGLLFAGILSVNFLSGAIKACLIVWGIYIILFVFVIIVRKIMETNGDKANIKENEQEITDDNNWK